MHTTRDRDSEKIPRLPPLVKCYRFPSQKHLWTYLGHYRPHMLCRQHWAWSSRRSLISSLLRNTFTGVDNSKQAPEFFDEHSRPDKNGQSLKANWLQGTGNKLYSMIQSIGALVSLDLILSWSVNIDPSIGIFLEVSGETVLFPDARFLIQWQVNSFSIK